MTRALLQSFADQAAIAVFNAQLYTQVSQQKQRMDAILDSAADGILILSPDHRIERMQPGFFTHAGPGGGGGTRKRSSMR